MFNDRFFSNLRGSGNYLFVIILAFVSTFPFIWMLIGATNTSSDITQGKLSLGNAMIQNVSGFFTQVNGLRVFSNTLIITMISVVLGLAICSIAGYGFEIFRSKVRDRIFNTLLLTMMIPGAVMLIPTFLMIARAGLINSFAGVVLPGLAGAFMIFYFRQSAKAFPRELRDAAKVDGLKEWQIFLFIFVPVMRSTYAAAFIMTFMGAWNAYLWPLVVLQTDDKKTITLALSVLAGGNYPDYGVILVGATLATLPILVVFFAMQRQFVAGMLGSVK
jgi:lactose/L-arabinose transport system permease protein